MPASTIRFSLGSDDVSVAQKTLMRTATGGMTQQPTLPRAWPGTLTTRTDANTGTITLQAGHGIETGDEVDIYWGTPGAGGGVQYAVTVGTVSGTAVPIDGGLGDNLPAQDSAVIVCKRTVADIDVAFDTLGELIWAYCAQRFRLEFRADDDSLIFGVNIRANEFWAWYTDSGYANPIDAPISYIVASQASTSPTPLSLGLVYNSVEA